MNIFGIIIFGTLLGTFFIKLVANILNLKAAGEVLPDEFRDVYDREAYEKSQNYLHHSTVFSLVTATFDLVVLLVFWFAGGFNYLDLVVRALGFSPRLTGIVYIGILLFLQGLVSLPFSI